jgi:hypothetical protein
MLIPLGILAASGAGVTSDYELIATAFGTGSSGTITFSSIPADYKHLQIRATVRSASTTTVRSINITFNNVTTNSYASHSLQGIGSSAPAASSAVAQSNINIADVIERSNSISGAYGAAIIDILDYRNTSKNTTVRALSGVRSGTERVALSSGAFFSTSAITTITLTANSGSYATATRFSIYGLKG